MKKTVFEEFLNKQNIKIWQHLLETREDEQTGNDIVVACKINRKNGYNEVASMIHSKLLVESKRVKNLRFYKLNMEDKNVKLMCKLFDNLLCDEMKHSNGIKFRSF